MGELARGSVTDRPWGRTIAALGLRGLTGQLMLVSDAKRFIVAFESGAVVASASPLASDAAVRVALTSHLVSSSQVPEIARRQAAAPERDEIDLIAELARLGPDHALRLRRRVIAQRAARTFSINHGEFVVTDRTELTILPGCELDVRAVIYLGARTNLSEQRLSAELDQLGSRFRLKPALDEDLPQFGFTDLEQPVVERLRDGGTVAEIEEFATSFVDGRTVCAVVYSLAVCNACEVTPGRPASAPARPASSTLPPLPTAGAPPATSRAPHATQPGVVPLAPPRPLAAARPSTQPPPPPPRAGRLTPDPSVRRSPTLTPPVPAEALRSARLTPSPLPARAAPGTLSARPTPIPTPTRPRAPTSPLATGSSALPPIEDGIDAPTQRDVQPIGMPMRQGGSSPGLPLPAGEALRQGGSSPGLPLPVDEAMRQGGRPFDDAEAPPPEPVILRVPSSRPPPRPRAARRGDFPQVHDVQALIAQRLTLLEHGADHFQLLGVAQDVSADLLRKAYFALARQLHPDRLAALGISDDGKHAQRLFAQINAGFAILSEPARRAHYLDILARGGEAEIRKEQAQVEDQARRILDAEEAFRRAEQALRHDRPEAAVTELELAVKLHPDEADYHALLAWAQFCAAPDKLAIAPATRRLLDKVLQRSPRAVAARFYLGRVERMLGRDQDALRHFQAVLAVAPGHIDAAAELRVLEARLAGGDKPGGGLFGRTRR